MHLFQPWELGDAALNASAAMIFSAMRKHTPWLPRLFAVYCACSAAVRVSLAFDPPGRFSVRSLLVTVMGFLWLVGAWWQHKYPHGAWLIIRYWGKKASGVPEPRDEAEPEQTWPPALKLPKRQ